MFQEVRYRYLGSLQGEPVDQTYGEEALAPSWQGGHPTLPLQGQGRRYE